MLSEANHLRAGAGTLRAKTALRVTSTSRLLIAVTMLTISGTHPLTGPDSRAASLAGASPATQFPVLYLPEVSKVFPGPLFAVAERGLAAVPGNCDWEEGTLAYGWIHAWRATQYEQYLRWARDWIDGCIPLKPSITHVNDGLLGYAAVVVYAQYGGSARLDFAQQVADYLMNTAPRTADGTLTHMSNQVWDDTLLGAVPFLLEMSKVTGNAAYADEAYAQVIKHANHLQDPTTGLYRHGWDESQNSVIGAYWGRGNSWTMLTDVEALTVMTATHPLRTSVLSNFQKQAAGLKPLQDASGLWHTVVTRPDFYLETSASALIGYAFWSGTQAGWLSSTDYAPAANAAIAGVWRKVLADGTVTDVSAGTGVQASEENYSAVPHSALQLHGQGVTLLLPPP